MRLVIAPPASGKSQVAGMLSSIKDLDAMSLFKTSYSQMTQRFGPDWYFNEIATQQKDIMIHQIRESVGPTIEDRLICVTAEAAFFKQGDIAAICLPDAADLYDRTVTRQDGGFVYPSREAAARIHAFYSMFAQEHGIRTFTCIQDAVVSVM